MSSFLHTLQARGISTFNIPFFPSPAVTESKSQSECGFIDPEIIEPECSLYEQVSEQWTCIKTVLKEDNWYCGRGLSEVEEAKFAAVLSNFAKACQPLMQWVEKGISIQSEMPPLPDGLVTTEEIALSPEESSQIEANLACLHKVMLKFAKCYEEFKVESEEQKTSRFVFLFTATLILMPLIAPLCAQLCIALAISASMAALFGKCFVFISVYVQFYRFLIAQIEGERRIHLNKHKNLFNQFVAQLEESLRNNMSVNNKIENMNRIMQNMQRELAEVKAAQQVQSANHADYVSKEILKQALTKSGIPLEQARIVLKSIEDLA